MKNEIKNFISNHDNWRNSCLNLIASENVMSDFVKQAFTSDFGHRYFFQNTFSTESGLSYEYNGTKFIKELYEYTTELANEVFGSRYANIDMHSGHLSNLNIILSYCKIGDTIMCSNTEFGGYPGLAEGKLPSYLGIKSVYIPQTSIGGQIDLQELEQSIIKHAPKIVMLSSSITLFPFPVKEVSDVCKKYNIPFCYDASHPLGLIAGGEFQKPFEEGADLIIGSTHKSFPGPQGGIILGKNKEYNNIVESTDFVTVDNIHLHRIAALSYSLCEMKHFGKNYARQIIKNTKALASALNDEGFTINFKDRGYSESHQLFIDTSQLEYSQLTSRFQECNIITDNSGRIGTSEITRYGLEEEDMKVIAKFMFRIADNEDIGKIKKDVIEFKSNFNKLHFAF
jgi:glycine hydroxymethyltransferase